ncbi:MalY/PatB family protein [Salsuginibacillus kocurii]|uniref:MalY/PatB family protein n=1 Tax=Salsuginibacillus kocurii TaxID=427078 RepID=UPI000381AD48|nr:MalY/PatB family protein [Salsuginibacillus kocurii]
MNFDEEIKRKHTHSMKWDMLQERYESDDLWAMWVADMDFKVPQEILDALQEVVDHGVFGYHFPPDSLKEEIRSWLDRRFDYAINPQQIVFTPGVVPAIHHLIQTFTNEGDGIVIQTPVYYPFFALVKENNRKLLENPLTDETSGFTMNFEHLEEQFKNGAKMLILCSPHNPIGRVWTEEEQRRLAELCEKYGVFVVSDEIHADLIFKGKHLPFSNVARDYSINLATCMAPSKTFNLAALQMSYVIFDDSTLQKSYEAQLKSNFVGGISPFAVASCEAAYRKGEPWLEKLLAYIQENISYVKKEIKNHLPEVTVHEPEGTYLIWIDFRKLGFTSTSLQKWLREEAGLALGEGHVFGKEGSGFARMNVACPKGHVEEGVRRLKEAYKKLPKHQEHSSS